jgi:hypothetical protein
MSEQFTYLQLEAALCVWECIGEWTLNADVTQMSRPEWIEMRENLGSAEMRHQSAVVGRWCLLIYDELTKQDRDFFDALAYDFEVIPMMLDYAYGSDGKPTMYAGALPDPLKVAQLVARRVLFKHFIWDCEQAAEKIWCYRDFVSDHNEKFEQAFEDGEDPAAFVKVLGEDYDLIKF